MGGAQKRGGAWKDGKEKERVWGGRGLEKGRGLATNRNGKGEGLNGMEFKGKGVEVGRA